jgi:predicted PurR-regulated permease PerM
MQGLMSQFGKIAANAGYGGAVGPTLEHLDEALPQIQTWVIGWIGRMFSNVVQLAGLVVVPVLAFYLLAERGAVRASLMRFVPADAASSARESGESHRSRTRELCPRPGGGVPGVRNRDGHRARRARHHPCAAARFLVAVAEILPFIGFWLAAAAIGLVGLGEGPMKAGIAIGAYAVRMA